MNGGVFVAVAVALPGGVLECVTVGVNVIVAVGVWVFVADVLGTLVGAGGRGDDVG